MAIFKLESTLTQRFQTTIPAPVRKVLHLDKTAKIGYRVTKKGTVEMFNAGMEHVDSALGPFLAMLDARLKSAPEKIRPYTEADYEADMELVKGVKVD